MKKIIFISFLIIISFIFLSDFGVVNACTMPTAQYTAGRACTSAADVSYFNSIMMDNYYAGKGTDTQDYYLVTQCSGQVTQYQLAVGKYNDCVGNLTAPCPSPNSTRRADTSISGSSCYCSDGYTNYKGNCVDNNTNCRNLYGNNSYWGSSSCQCSTGYQFNSARTACVQITCYANSSLINNQCVCNDGYINRNGNSCISYTDDCIRQFGANSIGTKGQNNNSSCNCEDGFEWNGTQTACVKKVVAPVVSPKPASIQPVKEVTPEETVQPVQPASNLTPEQINSIRSTVGLPPVSGAPVQQPKSQNKSRNIFSNIWSFFKNIFK